MFFSYSDGDKIFFCEISLISLSLSIFSVFLKSIIVALFKTSSWSIIDLPALESNTILSRSTKTMVALTIEKFVIDKTMTDKIRIYFFF